MIKLENEERLWFPVHVRGRHEKTICNELTKQGYEVYLPLIKRRRRWSDRYKIIELPLFPGYLFIYMDRRLKYYVLEVPGVQGFITFQGEMAHIPDFQIDFIHRMLERPETFEVVNKVIKTGHKVRVLSGPFIGMKGIVKDIKNKSRMYVNIDHIQHTLCIEVSEYDLELIGDGTS
ncbi:MAG: NusG antitermination factor [Marinimicrobia bacterium 46_47]|nr:MAG: NusG antitermination factor [Marinimicrobia bacterium 46_47]KUK92631.1 MAG: NusG antitermination factor [Marinimicrobia bacterium 46_43]